MIEALLGPLLQPLLASAGAGLAGTVLTRLNPQALAVKILLVLAFATSCAYGGWKLAQAFAAQERVAELNVQLAEQDRRIKVVLKTETKYVDRVVEIQTRGIDTRVEVPVYVTTKADAGCAVTAGFVELHNAAGEVRPPRPPADPDAKAEGVGLSTVASTVAKNYTECAVNAEIVRGWQEFYTDLKNSK